MTHVFRAVSKTPLQNVQDEMVDYQTYPRFPQVNLQPTMLGLEAASVAIVSESRSIPEVTAGKL
jgi:hypothetical protein